MPLDVLGCTRATLMHSTSFLPCLKMLGDLQCASGWGYIIPFLSAVFDTVRIVPSLLLAKQVRINAVSSDGCLGSINDERCSEVS